MKFYSIAGINVGFEPKYDMLAKRSEPYLCTHSGKTEFNISLLESEMRRELERQPEWTAERLEYMCVGAKFYAALIERGGFLLHASAVVVDNEGYAFSAPCGTGKSTHAALWLKHFEGRGAYIINDDKPAIRLCEDGSFAIWGTPFSGKHNINVNTSVPLKAVAFIERAQTNSISRIKPISAVAQVLQQTIRPNDEHEMDVLLSTLEKFAMHVPVYSLQCNMSDDAVKTAYRAMCGKINDI